MQIHVLAVGRLKQGPERDLARRYADRFEALGRKIGLKGPTLREFNESRARDAATRAAEEGVMISAALPDKAAIVALDERGDGVDSERFARLIATRRDSGSGDLAYVIGGADGLSPELRRKATMAIAFGPMTWPHQIVRVLLFEQLYRAATLLSGHPYHRA